MYRKVIKRLTLKNIPNRIENLKSDIKYTHYMASKLDLSQIEDRILHDKYVAELTDLDEKLANTTSAHRTLRYQEKRKGWHMTRYNTARESLVLRVLERLDDSIQAIESKLEELKDSSNVYNRCIASESFREQLANLEAKREQLLRAS